jgi:type II secretion system protein J
MNMNRSDCRRARAFTLLEVLVAVTVFAIVLAAVNTVLYGALRLRNRATESLEQGLPGQQALAVIQRDLANLVVPGGTLSGVLQTSSITNLVGGQSSPDFYTTTGLIDETSPWAEIQKVSYILVDSTNRTAAGRDLIRAVTRNLLPATLEEPPAQQWLMSGVQGLSFYYYDGTQWRDSWDSTVPDAVTGLTNTLPQAIKVQIQTAPEQTGRAFSAMAAPIELVVPVVIQARTNKSQTTEGGAR